MKKVLLILSIVAFVFASCEKNDESPVYSQAKLNGTWENVVKDDNNCVNMLKISASGMSEITNCPSSKVEVTYESYSFDGKKIKVKFMGIDVIFVINELTDTKLVLTVGNKKSEYKKN